MSNELFTFKYSEVDGFGTLAVLDAAVLDEQDYLFKLDITAMSEDETAVGEFMSIFFSIAFYVEKCKHVKLDPVAELEPMTISIDHNEQEPIV